MYLQYYALIFALFAIPSKNRYTWLCLVALCILLKLNMFLFDGVWEVKAIARTALIFIFSILLLLEFEISSFRIKSVKFNLSLLGCYQSFILLLFLVANLALFYDVAQNKHILIYNNFEGVIYGLVSAQFFGVFVTKIRDCINNYYTSDHSSNNNKQLVEKS